MQPATVSPASTSSTSLSPVLRIGPIDDLETSLIDRWLELNRATYRFLNLLREFDYRQGWKPYGCNDCAEWMDYRLKLNRKTALEKVRVARALWFVPKINAAFKAGKLSYSQVRALTRIANEQNEEELLAQADNMTAQHLEKYVQRLRQGDARVSEHMARTQQQGRSLLVFAESGELSAKLPPDQLALVQQALETLVDTLPEDPERDFYASRADALVEMARIVLAQVGEHGVLDHSEVGNTESGSANGETEDEESQNTQSQEPTRGVSSAHQILVHVDASALSGQGGEADYPLPVIKKLCCSGEATAVIKDGDRILNVGRKHRLVPPKIRQALAARDRQCQFPGCHHTQFLDAHHIKHWCDGGETRLDNLILLCSHHHTLMHEGGFSLKPRGDKYYFARPDGRPIEPPSSAEDGAANGVRKETQKEAAVH